MKFRESSGARTSASTAASLLGREVRILHRQRPPPSSSCTVRRSTPAITRREAKEDVEIGGCRFKAEVFAVEPLSNIAAVGAPDPQRSAEALAFEEHLDSIRPVPLCTAEFPLMERFPVFIRSHQLRWIEGQARQVNLLDGTLFIDAAEAIVGGTSGGPVVTADGLLLGVVSTAGGEAGKPMREAIVRRPHLMAPGWLARRMLDPGRELREMRRHIRARESG